MSEFIPIAAPRVGERELAYVTDAVRSGWVSSIGPYISRFEEGFAAYLGVSHGISVTNGTAALHLALQALGIGPGDEVLVPDLTFVAPVHAVLMVGATPVLVDVEPDTWCMDPVGAKRAITAESRAIIPVHVYGHPADLDPLHDLATEHGLFLIEDAAEAHGAEYKGRRVGSIGDVGVFSFYGNKIITTGEGGMLTTHDSKLAARLRFLKDHGMVPERRYYHTELAFNYRLTNIQAALGLAQLEQIDGFIEQRRRVYRTYADALAGAPLTLNAERPDTKNVYWMTSVVLSDASAAKRESVMSALRAQGVDSRPFFVPMHQLPHLESFRTVGRDSDGCPTATRLGATGFNLPSSATLDDVTIRRISSLLRDAVAQ